MSKGFKVSKVELNIEGLNEIMKSPAMQNILDTAGANTAAGAGGDYGYRTHTADYVAICNVYPTTKKAARDAIDNSTILKAAIGAGLKSHK